MNLDEYKSYLAALDAGQLLEELYVVKRSKDPEKYKLVEIAFQAHLNQGSQREAVRSWVQRLRGSKISVKDYPEPVEVLEAKMNSRGNAAIVRLKGETHDRYFAYKGEENAFSKRNTENV